MPIFEYACRKCGKQFEELVRGKEQPACPKCKSKDLEKLLSLPYSKTETTHDLAMRAAKKRDKKQAEINIRTQREYEAAHDD
jgi:putative FmdB family regulatory protein